MRKLMLLCVSLVVMAMIVTTAVAGEVPTAAPSAEKPKGTPVGAFLTSDGRLDLEAAKRAGFEGSLNLEGFDAHFDQATGEPIFSRAGPGLHPDDIYWSGEFYMEGLDWTVRAATVYNGDLIVGGSFMYADSSLVNHIARWDGASWHALGTGVGTGYGHGVNAFTIYDGKLIVGGGFATAGGIRAVNVAAWNGSDWDSLGAGVSSSVNALTVYGEKVIAGGRFTQAGGIAANHVASWDGSNWAALGSGVDDDVRALAIYRGNLMVAGDFQNAGGSPASHIAQWNGTAWTALGMGVDGRIRALTVHELKLIAGGDFSNAGGSSASYIASWDATSWTWSSFGTGASSNVCALDTLDDGDLIIGGQFSSVDGTPATRIARWDGFSWSALGSGPCVQPLALEVYNGSLVAGGGSTGQAQSTGGDCPSFLDSWDGLSWTTLSSASVPQGDGVFSATWAMTAYDDKLVVGGPNFCFAGGIDVRDDRIASWDGTSWSKFGDGPITSPRDFAVYRGHLIAGGGLYVESWNGAEWSAIGQFHLGAPLGFVDVLALYHGNLIAAGRFDTIKAGPSVANIAQWDGSAWSPVGGGVNDRVLALTVYDGKLIAGGAFDSAGSIPASYIASWDGASWDSLGAGTDDAVWPLAVYDGKLIAGGWFDSAGGIAAAQIASWDGASWSSLGAGIHGSVYALAVHDGKLIAGGDFDSAGGTPASYIASWDGSSWSPLGSGVNGPPNLLGSYDCQLYVGGQFVTGAGGKASSRIARWDKIDPTDTDGDGVYDGCDNCPTDYNTDQADHDYDGVGDICDNCEAFYNPDQEDTDVDGIGDVCAACPIPIGDMDNSGVVDGDDIDFLADYIYRYDPLPMGLGETDQYDLPTVSDILVLVDYVLNGGPEPSCPYSLPKYEPATTSACTLKYDGTFPAGATSMTLHLDLASTINIRGMTLPLKIWVDYEVAEVSQPKTAGTYWSSVMDFNVWSYSGLAGVVVFGKYSHSPTGAAPGSGDLATVDIQVSSASGSPRQIMIELIEYYPLLKGENVKYPMIVESTSPGNLVGWVPVMWACAGMCDNTDTGTDVEVDLSPELTLTFDEVTQEGATEFSIGDCPPGTYPLNVTVVDDLYCLSTTAEYTGDVEVCITYDDAGLDPVTEEPFIRLYHCEVCDGSDWQDVTNDGYPDTDNNVICGTSSSLSPFVAVLPSNCCVGITGNADGDPEEICDISDLTTIIDYLFISYEEPDCMPEANTDGSVDGVVDISDLTKVIDYLFITYTPPAPCL